MRGVTTGFGVAVAGIGVAVGGTMTDVAVAVAVGGTVAVALGGVTAVEVAVATGSGVLLGTADAVAVGTDDVAVGTGVGRWMLSSSLQPANAKLVQVTAIASQNDGCRCATFFMGIPSTLMIFFPELLHHSARWKNPGTDFSTARMVDELRHSTSPSASRRSTRFGLTNVGGREVCRDDILIL